MSSITPDITQEGWLRVFRQDGPSVCEYFTLPFGELVAYTCRAPGKDVDGGRNEDALAVVQTGEDSVAFIIADGMGGYTHGAEASMLTISELVRNLLSGNSQPLCDILNAGLQQASRLIQDRYPLAGTTVTIALFKNKTVTTCHAGDSEVLIRGRDGEMKMHTIPHSPVGQACAQGLFSEQYAMFHEFRHVISNAVGLPDFVPEFGKPQALEPQDILLLASDGLYDNLFKQEILDILADDDSLLESTNYLVSECQRRMSYPHPDTPHKPDDLSILTFRHHAG